MTIENNPINVQNSSQQCTDFDGSTYDRTFRCEFKHKGIDRYYYIQLGHPEAEGQSSIYLIFTDMVVMHWLKCSMLILEIWHIQKIKTLS